MIVVAAGIVQRDGKIMVCQRKAGKANGLKWEFPGGKLEPGESPEAALERELLEELGIQTRTCRIYDAKHRMESGRELLILFYFSEILSGEPQPIDCADIAWVLPSTLPQFDLAPADAEVARRLSLHPAAAAHR